jgi:hypothetical protein
VNQESKSRQRFLLPFVLLIVFPFGSDGCCRSFDSDTSKKDEAAREWLRYWPGKYDWVETSHWKSVTESKMPQAELLLREAGSVRLTDAQAVDLTGSSSQSTASSQAPYLLRGVNASPVRFPLEIFVRSNGNVWVGGGANSQCPVPMQRRSVVAWLDQPPHEVYVTFIVGK